MTHRTPGIVVLLACLAAAAAWAGEQRLRYFFEGKKNGDSAVPHEIYRGEWAEMDNPFAPKGKELETAAYTQVGSDSDDNGSAEASAEGKARAAFLIVFKLEKEVHEAAKTWKSLELEVGAVAGPAGEEAGPSVEAELYRADKKAWSALKNDMPEGRGHHYVIPTPLAGICDREGRVAFRLSCKAVGKPNKLLLDFIRLVLKLEQASGGDSLTYVSLPGRCKLTRPDDPLWRFLDSDDWFIRLVKGDDHAVDITVTRYDSTSNYKFGGQSVSGDNAKGLAEGSLESLLESYKPKAKPKVVKGQLGAYKTQEFAFVGEAKADGTIMDIREIYIREKGDTYRVSVWGNAQTMKEDRFLVERALKTLVIGD